MWMIEILADESDAAPVPRDALPAFLAAHGIPPEVMWRGLAQLRWRPSMRFWKRSEESAWEIGDVHHAGISENTGTAKPPAQPHASD